MKRLFIPLMLVACVSPVAGTAEDHGPAKGVPELQVLSNYVGKWDVSVTSRGARLTKGETTGKWILDGRFVQQTGYLSSDDGSMTLRVRNLITYDQDQKIYRWWSFMSNGMTSEATGTWDAKIKTMTEVHRREGSSSTTTSNFAKGGIERWSLVVKDQDGNVLRKMTGVNTRRNGD